MKLASLNKRYASAMALVMMSGALWACSGDDTMGTGTGGSGGGTGGSGGTTATGGSADSGRDTGSGGANADARTDGRVDSSSGGSGGTSTGTGGAIGTDASDAGRDASADAGTGGSDGAAGDARPEASLPDTSTDAPRVEAGPDGAPTSDGATVPDSTTSDVNDARSPPNDSGSDVNANDAPALPNDVTNDQAHAACTAQPAGATTIFSFDTTADAIWTFDTMNNPTLHDIDPPQGTTMPAWDNLDGCLPTGELKFTIPFDFSLDASPIQGAVFNANLPSADWTGRTAVHLKIKVESPAGLQFVNPFLQLDSPYGFWSGDHDGSTEYVAANLGVGVWTELIITLPTDVDGGPVHPANIGLQVFSIDPGTVVLDIDSVWLE